MYKMLLIILVISNIMLACTGQPPVKHLEEKEAALPYLWQKVTDAAAFPKSYNFQLFTIHDTLWAFHSPDIWFSTNGKYWTKTPLTNFIKNNAFLDYVYFNNAIYALGTFDGNIERYKLTTTIAKSSNFKDWEVITSESNLPKRFFYHPFVFNNKIWIIGGNDGTEAHDDIWNSGDGVHWVKAKDKLPFGKRENSQIVVLNNKLYLLNNDVWSSSDGLNWIQVTPEIVKGQEIFGYAAVVFDNRIWLLGCNRNGQFSSKVLLSEDGKNWQEMDAPWSPRGAIAACVYKNKIYMTGGKYGGTPNQPVFVYSNDVWTLELNNKSLKNNK